MYHLNTVIFHTYSFTREYIPINIISSLLGISSHVWWNPFRVFPFQRPPMRTISVLLASDWIVMTMRLLGPGSFSVNWWMWWFHVVSIKAVQEMCVSRPRWCEAIFRENPKTRKRTGKCENRENRENAKTRKHENGQENAKTAKTRKPRTPRKRENRENGTFIQWYNDIWRRL